MLGNGQVESEEGNPGGGTSGKFFRASVILPRSRDQGAERECRMTRRREVNELAMRLGVGGIGGVLEAGAKRVAESASTEGVEVGAESEQISEANYGEVEADPTIVLLLLTLSTNLTLTLLRRATYNTPRNTRCGKTGARASNPGLRYGRLQIERLGVSSPLP
jgi:hypothetical protein